MNNKTVLSICVITYNHSKYISQAIDSFLMQKTDFDFEIIIADDASIDNNQEIIRAYQKKYPDKIKPILRSKNVGMNNNFVDALNHCTGKYIAICEGDDYWTDPLKLQKQVDFLEANPEYSLCFHNALVLWDDKSQPPKYFCAKNQKKTSTIEDVIEKWFIPSASMVFRKEYISPLPEWFKDIYNGDWALHMLCADKGKIGYIDEVMGVYRKNDGSLSGGIGKNMTFVNNRKLELLNYFNKHTDFNYGSIIKKSTEEIERTNRFSLSYRIKKTIKTMMSKAFGIKIIKI